jgi:O-antigen ligase
MIVQTLSPTKPLIGVVVIGVFVALGTVLALSFIGPMKVAFVFGGLVLLVPALIVRDPTAYGLFLLAFSIPMDVYTHTTNWLADPQVLLDQYGFPASGTSSVAIYLTDVILIAMLLPWLAQLCRRQRSLYFPKIGYIFLLYLAWALIVSLIEAKSLYLSIFEWVREILYFIFFLYIVNNVVTRAQFRAVALALFVGLVIESVAVIIFFSLSIGTEFNFFRDLLYSGNSRGETTLTVAESGTWKHVARSAGTFGHPSQAAYYFEYILPIVLGCLMAARRARDRILFGTVLGIGCVALVLTFSRSGILGFLVMSALFFSLARWSRLISRQMFACCVFVAAISAALSTPLLINYLATRPDAGSFRWKLIKPSVDAFSQRPIWGAGLNNSSAVTEGSRSIVMTTTGHSNYQLTVVHNHYLIVLVEVGIIGFLLFFAFFWQTIATAVRHMRTAETEPKLLLVGIVSALGGIGIHNFGDPFGGHPTQTMLWLHAGLVFAICRRVQAEPALPSSTNEWFGDHSVIAHRSSSPSAARAR